MRVCVCACVGGQSVSHTEHRRPARRSRHGGRFLQGVRIAASMWVDPSLLAALNYLLRSSPPLTSVHSCEACKESEEAMCYKRTVFTYNDKYTDGSRA